MIRPALLTGIVVSTAVGVVACGGGSSSTSASSSAAATTSAAASSSSSRGRAAGAANPFADPTVAACLKAAGIAVPSFTRPSGSFTRPSGSFTRPSGSFTRPSGSFTRPAGGGFGTDTAAAQEIQQALKACGITLPTGRGGAGAGGTGGAAPSATPSS
jgi:hypothetical protein